MKSHRTHHWTFAALSLLASVIAILVFSPGLNGDFILDDGDNIVRNTALHLNDAGIQDFLYAIYSFQPGNGTRFLPMLTFALDFMRSGLDPAAFKFTNLLIHGLTTFVVAMLLRRLFVIAGTSPNKATWFALGVSLAWAIHPLQVSSVLYVVQRMQTMVNLFILLALWAYVRMRECQVEGARSRSLALLTALFWALAFTCKEDAVLFPLYTFALECTLLQFRMKSPDSQRKLHRVYMVLAFLGIALYLGYFVPHYWHANAYEGRSFNSPERLWTEGRILVMHFWQILWPSPASMPFYYDDLEVSRNWLTPLTTVPSALFLCGLVAWAVVWRKRRPLFAFGIFLFFAGHFLTSNVYGLELVFEHRNHLPLLGILLAAFDLCTMAVAHTGNDRDRRMLVPAAAILLLLGGLACKRSYDWGSPERFARTTVQIAPKSERAWIAYTGVFIDRSGFKRGPDLDRAIQICEVGVNSVEQAPLLRSNLLIYKTVNGTVTSEDWNGFLNDLARAAMTAQNRQIMWTFINNQKGRAALDPAGVLRTIELTEPKVPQDASQYLQIAAYVYNETDQPRKAFMYMEKAVALSPQDDFDILLLIQNLRDVDNPEWAERLDELRKKRPLRGSMGS